MPLYGTSYIKRTVQTDAVTSVYEFVNQFSLFEVFKFQFLFSFFIHHKDQSHDMFYTRRLGPNIFLLYYFSKDLFTYYIRYWITYSGVGL